MNARIVTCGELAKNNADLKKIRELLFIHQTSNTPASILLPWLPNSARKRKKEAVGALFGIIYAYVEKRRHSEPTGDAIDTMIADGEATERIVGVSFTLTVVQEVKPNLPQDIMGTLFVAIVNTGVVCEFSTFSTFHKRSIDVTQNSVLDAHPSRHPPRVEKEVREGDS